MKRQPLVSVIIPVYNAEQYLKECVDSVIHQTYDNIDIVLVDDGSKDGSSKICDKYYKNDERVQVIHKENGGLVSAWIKGVEFAKGEYLVFLDSDDWIDLFMIEDMVRQATGKGKEIVCGNYIIEKENQSISVKQAMRPDTYDRVGIEKKIFPGLLGKENRLIHYSRCMKLISKELILENIPYTDCRLTMGEDASIMLPAMWDADYIVVMEDAFYYHYRFVDASMVHKYNRGLYDKIELLYETLKQTINKKITNEKQKELFEKNLQKEYVFLFFLILKNELRGPREFLVPRIQETIKKGKKDKKLEEAIVEVNSNANKLLYFIFRHPGKLQILFGKAVIGFFDKKQ